MRHGVAKDGSALFDFMPFQHLSNEDMIAIVSYLRSQPAVSHAVPKVDLNLMGKAVKAFVMQPVGITAPIANQVQPDTTASYGAYLANNVANCRGCHTERNLQTGAFIGEPYAGGTKFESAIEKRQLLYYPKSYTASGYRYYLWLVAGKFYCPFQKRSRHSYFRYAMGTF